MFTRLVRAANDQVKAFTRTESIYYRAHNSETTELHVLTAPSDDNLSVDNTYSTKASDSKNATYATHNKPRSVRRYRQQLTGWRFGVLNFAIWASIVFHINLIVTIWGSVGHRETKRVLSEGECGRTKRLNSGIHVLINVLSTILLSGSNYCMQCLSAPTREEVSKAHAARTWLDIGVPSFRNLRHISRRRLLLWLLLGVSSVPLHLLYNSAVYASISINSYDVVVVSQAFLDDPQCQNCTNAVDTTFDGDLLKGLWDKSRNGSLQRLDPTECIDAYGVMIQSTKRNLLAVIANDNLNPGLSNMHYPPDTTGINNTNMYMIRTSSAAKGLSHYRYSTTPFDWICSGLIEEPNTLCLDRLTKIRSSSQPWTISSGCYSELEGYCDRYRWPVDYCLSESAEPRCQLHFNTVNAVVVTVLNFFKAVLMFYTVYSTKENPLMTMGDAVSSFLDDRDTLTKSASLLTIGDLRNGHSAGVNTWNNPSQRWKDATSKRDRIVTLILFAIALVTVIALLVWGVREMNQTQSTSTYDALHLGFGTVDPRTVISGGQFPTNMVALTLIANLPQLILSLVYFAYNGLFTAMLMSYEWMSYAHKRKGLRVSRKPFGYQRSTYFLQLPYRFGLPLVILSGTLHWLVSQSIFVVAFDVYTQRGDRQTTGLGWKDDAINQSVAYSPTAMLAVVVLGVFMVATVISTGYIPYQPGIPLAGSCSLAISAACHPDQRPSAGDRVMSEQKIQWGVVSTSVDGTGHCAFLSNKVKFLVKELTYIYYMPKLY